MAPSFLIVGLSHKTAPVELRERLAVLNKEKGKHLEWFLKHSFLKEAVILATCNRVEVYLHAEDVKEGENLVRRYLESFCDNGHGGLAPVFYAKKDREALSHLFRVSSGMDSMVLGESQILGQVKEAFAEAQAFRSVGSLMSQCFQKAFHVAKKVRTETGIGVQPVSVSSAAIFLAEKIFGSLREKRVLCVGAGEMVELALQYFVSRGGVCPMIVNRTFSKAHALAEKFQGEALPFEKIPEALIKADVVFTSTQSSDYLIQADHVVTAMQVRKGAPLFFVDIAVPRNVDPAVNTLDDVYVYDIDDLQGVVEEGLEHRKKEARAAEAIIIREAEDFLKTAEDWDLSPVLGQLAAKFESMREQELQRAFQKMNGVSEQDKKLMIQCTESIVKKILSDPILILKARKKEERQGDLSFLRRLFDLPE